MDPLVFKALVPSTPSFVIDQHQVLGSLATLSQLRQACAVKVLYSIKALPAAPVLELAKPFVDGYAASSWFEAQLAHEVLAGQGELHLGTPGLSEVNAEDLSHLVSHVNFNSLNQLGRFAKIFAASSLGIRVNPKLSFAQDSRYDPCRPFSKLGVDIDALWLSDACAQVQGLHVHTVFSTTDFTPLLKTADKLCQYFGNHLKNLQWLNLGGGYLFNQIKDHTPFINLVKRLRQDYGLTVYIEPGKDVVGQAGYLVTTVIDLFDSDGKAIAVLDTSVNHNPEVFEYQRRPELYESTARGTFNYLLVGCSCLAGDVFGEYLFNQPLKLGDRLVFKHVGAYSLIKASRFNGYPLPNSYLWDGIQLLCTYQDSYGDFKRQWGSPPSL